MCHSWLSEQFSELQAAYGTTFRATGGYLKAGTSFQNIFTGRMFRIMLWKQAETLFFIFSTKSCRIL
jgi:hypothetical protein